MKIILLSIIRIYWAVFPKDKRRKCIFKLSCSKHVYQVTKKEGLLEGFNALKYRYKNCRNGYHIFENHIDGSKMMILPNGQLLQENEIAVRFYSCS
jgi:putative component of membrane protein insertase Oxa1/YidC/SpoIIIJ protein YidD